MPSRMVFTTTERERLGDFSSPAALAGQAFARAVRGALHRGRRRTLGLKTAAH